MDYLNLPVHRETERIFRELLPKQGMTVREEQVTLCHHILDTLISNRTALFDAGVGIGKTYAYLTACILLQCFYSQTGVPSVVISTSSVTLQEALLTEYIPFLSQVLSANQIIQQPIQAVVRKGKERFVCDIRLSHRLTAVSDKPKNVIQKKTLFSLQHCFDLDKVSGLSSFDRQQICVPVICPKYCPLNGLCRYHQYLKGTRRQEIFIQLCNHHYLLADSIHRQKGIQPLLTDYRALVIDEAHKLPAAAREMFSRSVTRADFQKLCQQLEKEHCSNSAKWLWKKALVLFDSFRDAALKDKGHTLYSLREKEETALQNVIVSLERILDRLGQRLSGAVNQQLRDTTQLLKLFWIDSPNHILYIQYDKTQMVTLCAVDKETPRKLEKTLWNQKIPIILTSGTLKTGGSFAPIRHELSLPDAQEFTIDSPFEYEENCLLYIPEVRQKVPMNTEAEADYLAAQIEQLIAAAHGHTLVLFTSYALMKTVHRRIKPSKVPLLTVWRHSEAVIQQFKQLPNGILFAAGSCWEGMDFPGDQVSSLIIPRLPFPVPTPWSKAEQAQYPALSEYIQAVVVPDMQRKLRQGFGRAIRTETDTCIVSILDQRAAAGERYCQVALEALPKMPVTHEIQKVEQFMWQKKGSAYFCL
ncbi:MAG: ATP-dependent DNA helicase [Oscillospiraceae bacterium]|nr:ATP-dependent DNA helicase [Oscillospiraceae bacterium]